MSKNQKKPKNAFNYTPTHTLPKLGAYATTWDLQKHYYASSEDPQIEKDVKKVETAYKNFAKNFKTTPFTSDASTLLKALTAIEKLSAMPEGSKVSRYFSFRSTLDVADSDAEQRLNLLSDRFSKAGNEILFFEIELGKIDTKTQEQFLKDASIAKFSYYLKRVFEGAKHTLSEPEEKILNLMSNTSYSMWVDATEKMLGNTSITYKKKKMPLTTAIEKLNTYPSAEKPKLWKEIVTALDALGSVTENELTAIVTTKKVSDELRGYTKPYSATVESYEDNIKSTERLIEAVSTVGFDLSKRFYKAKAKLHKKTKLSYAQKYDSIGTEPSIPFKQAVEICRDVFYGLKNEYGVIFDDMLKNGQIDVYPKKGKRGGAFMSDAIGVPTKVLLNHADDFKSLETLAHEMGHAIHAHRSKTQPPLYQGHSIITAETASTLFENLLFDAVYTQASEQNKVVLLHDRLSRDISTIQRQIAFFNFELEMHTTIREKGGLSHKQLRVMLQKHLQSYLGDSVEVTELDGSSYVYISHFRYGFYVYSYAFGILMSTYMSQKYAANSEYIEKIDSFLCSGKSDTVENIFASIGIATNQKNTFTDALKTQEAQVAQFERFVAKK
ncbi:MAG: hypothetical protein RLZZ76_563 [Candidatus Parcubacteria bacterium]|jgi:oligoendopeptidase F